MLVVYQSYVILNTYVIYASTYSNGTYVEGRVGYQNFTIHIFSIIPQLFRATVRTKKLLIWLGATLLHLPDNCANEKGRKLIVKLTWVSRKIVGFFFH